MNFVTENMSRSADKIAWYNGLLPERRSQLAVSHPYQIPSLVFVYANFGHIVRLHEETPARPVCTPMSRSTAHGAQSWVGTSFWPAPLWMDQPDPKGQQRYCNCTLSSEKKRPKVYSTYFNTLCVIGVVCRWRRKQLRRYERNRKWNCVAHVDDIFVLYAFLLDPDTAYRSIWHRFRSKKQLPGDGKPEVVSQDVDSTSTLLQPAPQTTLLHL